MKNVYLILAIAGAVIPYLFFLDFFANQGVNLVGFVGSLFVNGAAGGFAADVLISSAVFWVYLFSRTDGPSPWIFIGINLTIGLSCALPAYLYIMTKNPVAAPAA